MAAHPASLDAVPRRMRMLTLQQQQQQQLQPPIAPTHSGTIMIVLAPLLETIPPFGAALVAFTTPPIVRWDLAVQLWDGVVLGREMEGEEGAPGVGGR